MDQVSARMRARGWWVLSWAFLRAGSHNVIGALWEVNDASTPLLMDRLYGELAGRQHPGRSPACGKVVADSFTGRIPQAAVLGRFPTLYRVVKKLAAVRQAFSPPHRDSGCQFFLGTRIPYQNMNCHPACPGVPWDRSVAKEPAVISTSNQSRSKLHPPLCHPERSRGICSSLH